MLDSRDFASTPSAAPRHATLADLRRGQAAQIVSIRQAGEMGERLLEMGLTPGTRVRLQRIGLGGNPLQVQLRGYALSLRRRQAEQIDVVIGT